VHESEEQRSSMGARAAAPRVPLLALLGFLAAVGVAQMGMEMERGVAIDYYQFWAVAGAGEALPGESVYALTTGERLARILLERAAEIESPARRAAARFRANRIDVVSTPFFYACFRAVWTGDYDTDLRRYRLGSLVAFVLATLLAGRLVGCTPGTTLAALAFFLWAFPPLRFDLSEGNVNAVQLAMLALPLWLRRDPDRAWRTVAAGCVLSLAVLFKPNLATVVALLVLGWGVLGRKRDVLRAALGAALGGAIAVAASAWLLGATASWGDWLRALSHLQRDFAVGVAQGNLGGARLVGDALGWDPTVLLLTVLVGIVASRLWALRRALRGAPAAVPLVRDVDALLMALGPAVAILGTAIAWPHYAILCVPLCLVCLHRLEAGEHFMRVPVLLMMVALAGFSSTAWLDAAGVQAPLAQGLALALGVLALYVAGVWALARLARDI
jgi:hypothetical protein